MDNALKRILYVEDDDDIRAVARLALESIAGFELEVCENGLRALERAEAFAPQLILLDVMMPGLDGPATLDRLRQIPALQGTPAVFMTAKVQPSEVAALRAAGAADVIPKPFDPMTLGDNLRAIWERGRG
ncbi:MAG: response regulator [Steroidobacteraceae bacterium]